MNIGQEVIYNGHKLDKVKGNTTITRRIEPGIVTNITPQGWINVKLKSGILVSMSEERMNIACACRFFVGEDVTPTDDSNLNCGHPIYGGNCDDPTHPCSCHFDESEAGID